MLVAWRLPAMIEEEAARGVEVGLGLHSTPILPDSPLMHRVLLLELLQCHNYLSLLQVEVGVCGFETNSASVDLRISLQVLCNLALTIWLLLLIQVLKSDFANVLRAQIQQKVN